MVAFRTVAKKGQQKQQRREKAYGERCLKVLPTGGQIGIVGHSRGVSSSVGVEASHRATAGGQGPRADHCSHQSQQLCRLRDSLALRRCRPLSLTWKPTKMAEVVQMFLFLYKSKYRRKASARASAVALVCTLLVLASAANAYSNLAEPSCDFDSCVNGACVNDSCLCHEGWQGPACQYCGGKIR